MAAITSTLTQSSLPEVKDPKQITSASELEQLLISYPEHPGWNWSALSENRYLTGEFVKATIDVLHNEWDWKKLSLTIDSDTVFTTLDDARFKWNLTEVLKNPKTTWELIKHLIEVRNVEPVREYWRGLELHPNVSLDNILSVLNNSKYKIRQSELSYRTDLTLDFISRHPIAWNYHTLLKHPCVDIDTVLLTWDKINWTCPHDKTNEDLLRNPNVTWQHVKQHKDKFGWGEFYEAWLKDCRQYEYLNANAKQADTRQADAKTKQASVEDCKRQSFCLEDIAPWEYVAWGKNLNLAIIAKAPIDLIIKMHELNPQQVKGCYKYKPSLHDMTRVVAHYEKYQKQGISFTLLIDTPQELELILQHGQGLKQYIDWVELSKKLPADYVLSKMFDTRYKFLFSGLSSNPSLTALHVFKNPNLPWSFSHVSSNEFMTPPKKSVILPFKNYVRAMLC